jgi:hypothetical protein
MGSVLSTSQWQGKTFFVDMADIAAVISAVGNGAFGRCVGTTEGAFHDLRAVYPAFAGFAPR